jgi:Kef-type K+ transport system membrane component KefB
MLLTHWWLANLQVVLLSLFLGPEFGFSSILEKDETNVSIAIHPICISPSAGFDLAHPFYTYDPNLISVPANFHKARRNP